MHRRQKALSAIASVAVLLGGPALADPAEAIKNSRLLMEHWQCTHYASDFEDEERSEKHFVLGLDAGRQFYGAIEDGAITEEQIRTSVHPFLHLFMDGPSGEFILGQIHRSLRESVTEELRKLDGDRIEDHVDEDFNQMLIDRAQKQYGRKNCDLLIS